MTWYQRIGHQLFEPDREQTPGEIIVFRLFELFVLGYTIYYVWKWGFYTELRNIEVVLPLGIANYFDVSLLFSNNLTLINAGVITALIIPAYMRRGPKWIYMVILILFHLQYVTRFSQGEIPHSQNLIGMSVFAFAIGTIFFPGKKELPRFVMGAVIFFIGLGYTSAFFAKLIGTGINWADGRHLWLWISEKGIDILSRDGAYSPNFLQQLALGSTAAATMILLIGWLTELIGFTMWWNRIRPYTTTLLIGMHFGITLTMNIRFDAFVLQLIIVGYPWYLIADHLVEQVPKPLQLRI